DLHTTYFPRDKGRLTERDLRSRRFVGISGRKFINDTVVTGFALMVTERGHKSLVYRYRRPDGRTNTIRCQGANVEQARAEAAGYRAEVLAGRDPDPKLKVEAPVQGITLRKVVPERALFNFKSRGEFIRSLNNHVMPTLGDRPYESITR